MSRNRHLQLAKSGLRNLLRHEKDAAKRNYIQNIIGDIDRGVMTYEQWIKDAKMIGFRNPSFDDDSIGYPDDDFDDEE
jgi:hypothetical protein